MSFDKFVAVSGKPGLFRMAANRKDGLIIEDIDTGKKSFASSRIHQFTPLEYISIYTEDDDTVALKDVFIKMQEQLESNPPPKASKASKKELQAFFIQIVPDYDEDRVHDNDIKKVIKWFNYLNERSLLVFDKEEGEEE